MTEHNPQTVAGYCDCGARRVAICERQIARLKAEVARLQSMVDGLAHEANQLENDREYNAGLVKQRDAEVARMRGVVGAAKVSRLLGSADEPLCAAIDALEGEGREKEDATHASLD